MLGRIVTDIHEVYGISREMIYGAHAVHVDPGIHYSAAYSHDVLCLG